MVILALPIGSAHGWGNMGRWLTREMARLTEVHLLPTRPLQPEALSNEIEFVFLRRLASRVPELSVEEAKLPASALAPVFRGMDFTSAVAPDWTRPRGTPNVGYTFFERPLVTPREVDNARRYFDCILTGSSYCTAVLKANGVSAGTLIQGVDPQTFHPLPEHRKLLQDHFVIFSGSVFELRKGQDLVIRAVKVMQERHPDVALVAAWHSSREKPHSSMAGSPYLTLPAPTPEEQQSDYRFYVHRLLRENGVDANRIILIPRRPQEMMAPIYHETDVGLFPSRCESGTNLVLMEYMACGKPAIASWTSGHRDLLSDDNALLLRSLKPMVIQDGQRPPYEWDDPDLEEIIEKLEWAYQNRDALRNVGERGARDMSHWTWSRMAEDLYARLSGARPLAD